MCDNSRECDAASAAGFKGPGRRRPLDDVPDTTPLGAPATADVHPGRELIDKLGVKPGMRVAVLGVSDDELVSVVGQRASELPRTSPPGQADAIFFEAGSIDDLARLPELAEHVELDGMLWVLWPKGRAELRQSDVQHAGLDAGLVDVKVVSVSESLSGLKFVYRLADRREGPTSVTAANATRE